MRRHLVVQAGRSAECEEREEECTHEGEQKAPYHERQIRHHELLRAEVVRVVRPGGEPPVAHHTHALRRNGFFLSYWVTACGSGGKIEVPIELQKGTMTCDSMLDR